MKQAFEDTNVTIKWTDLNNQCNEETTEFFLQALFMYGENTEELIGFLHTIDGTELASIETLKAEIDVQRVSLRYNYVDRGEAYEFVDFKPRDLSKGYDNFVVCQEGVFEWNWEKEEYEFIGTLERTVRTPIEIEIPLPNGQTIKITSGYQDLAVIDFG